MASTPPAYYGYQTRERAELIAPRLVVAYGCDWELRENPASAMFPWQLRPVRVANLQD